MSRIGIYNNSMYKKKKVFHLKNKNIKRLMTRIMQTVYPSFVLHNTENVKKKIIVQII